MAERGRPRRLLQLPDLVLGVERRQGLGRQLAVPAGLRAGPQEQGQLALGERGRGELAGAAGPPAGPVPNAQRATGPKQVEPASLLPRLKHPAEAANHVKHCPRFEPL